MRLPSNRMCAVCSLLCWLFLIIWMYYAQQEIDGQEVSKCGKEIITHQLPTKREMDKMTHMELAHIYHSHVNNIQMICHERLRMGKIDDGGWDVCDDPEFRPRKNCLVYSFGINFDFSFDDEIAETYGCEVHSFDPETDQDDHKRSAQVEFHSIGLAGYNKNFTNGKTRTFFTLQSIKSQLGHKDAVIDILKLDIEEWEWHSLQEMISSGVLSNVRQLAVEFHVTIRPEPDKEKYIRSIDIMRKLQEIGFRIFWSQKNLWCKFQSNIDLKFRSGCHEVYLLKT